MKLKCLKHDRRVHVLSEGKTVHREDGTRCSLTYGPFAELTEQWQAVHTPSVRIGDDVEEPYRVWLMQRNTVKRWRTNHKGKGSPRSQFWGRDHV